MSDGAEELGKLREALGPLAERAVPTESCPSPDTIWAGVQGELPPDELRAVVDHMATCLVCAEAWEVAEDLNASRAAAGRAERSSPPALPQRWVGWAGAAAALFLLVLGAQWLPWGEWVSDPGLRGSEGEAIRSLIPEDEPLSRQDCVLRWEGPDEISTYDLRVSWATAETYGVIVEVEELEVPEYRIAAKRLREIPPGAQLVWRVAAKQGGKPILTRSFVSNLER